MISTCAISIDFAIDIDIAGAIVNSSDVRSLIICQVCTNILSCITVDVNSTLTFADRNLGIEKSAMYWILINI